MKTDIDAIEVEQNELETMDSGGESAASVMGLDLSNIDIKSLLSGMPLKEEGLKSKDNDSIHDGLPNFKQITDKLEQVAPEIIEEQKFEIPDEAFKAKPEPKQETKEAKTPLELKDFVETLENTKVLHKVDGEMVEVDIKEAVKKVLNDYAGHQAVDKRFTELDKDKKSWYNEKKQVENYLENFGKKIKEGDVEGALEYFGQFAQVPGHVIKEHLFAKFLPQLETRLGMTPDQIEAERLRQENEYYRSLKESELSRRTQEQAKSSLQSTINSLRETHQITEEEWNKAFQQLDSTLPPTQEIKVSMIKDHVLGARQEQSINSRVEKAFDKVEDVTPEMKSYMLDIAKKHPEFDDATLQAIVQEALKTVEQEDVGKNLSEKVRKTNSSSSEVPLDMSNISKEYIKKLLESDY